MCSLNCSENSYYVCLHGGKKDSRELTFIATPNDGFQVKEWSFNGKTVIGNETNFFTAVIMVLYLLYLKKLHIIMIMLTACVIVVNLIITG